MPFLLFTRWGRNDSYDLRPYGQKELAEGWSKTWKGVGCVTVTHKKVGSYSENPLWEGSSKAYQSTWDVRVIRLPDGKTFQTRLTADPPQVMAANHSGDVRADATPQMQEWLRGLPE
jgi:hypothetical protein